MLQEQIRGWLAYLQRARELDSLLRWFAKMNVLPFNEAAQAQFRVLRKQCRRLGTLDLRIASIALTADSILLSRNLRDFRQVPGLRVEDWVKPD
jgi:tRNA(fMet)-specific endonuclease VapC